MIRAKNVFEVLVVAALFAPRPALAQGQGGFVVAERAPVYVHPTGDQIEYSLRKGDRIAGVTTFGFSKQFHFESKNDRLHVEYVDSRGFLHTAWMRPSDLARFTYECSCDRGGLCSPWEQGKLGTWNHCFTDGAERAVARLAPTPPPPPPTEPPAPAVAERKEKPFSNDDVVALVKAGLDDATVIAKIERASGVDLDVSTEALVKLKKQGASNKVVQAMVKRAGERDQSSSPPTSSKGTIADRERRQVSASGATGGPLPDQGASKKASTLDRQLPEFFGFYAKIPEGLVSLHGGRSTKTVATVSLNVYSLDRGLEDQYIQAPQLPSTVQFSLYDSNPASFLEGLALWRLAYARNLVSSADPNPFGRGPVPRPAPINRWMAARLESRQIRLLSKPVAAQVQMLELAPDHDLTPGVYTAFQKSPPGVPEWWVIFAVGNGPESTKPDCADIVFPSGTLGQMEIHDYFMTHGPAAFPLLTKDHYRECGPSN